MLNFFEQNATHLLLIGSIQAFGTASAVFPADFFQVPGSKFKVQSFIILNIEL